MSGWGDHPLDEDWLKAVSAAVQRDYMASIRKRKLQAVVHWLWHTLAYLGMLAVIVGRVIAILLMLLTG